MNECTFKENGGTSQSKKAPARLNKQQSSESTGISQGLALNASVTLKNLQLKQSDADNSSLYKSKKKKERMAGHARQNEDKT